MGPSGAATRAPGSGVGPASGEQYGLQANLSCGRFLQSCAAARRAARNVADDLEELLTHRIPDPAELRALRNAEPELRRALDVLNDLLDRSALRHQTGQRTEAKDDGLAPGVGYAPKASAGMRCNLHGTIDSMPLTSVLQMLARANKNGLLRVQMGDTVLSFHFADGHLVRSEGLGDGGPRLGELLVEAGAIRKTDLSYFLQDNDDCGLPLGEALERAGLVDRETICAALADQVSGRIGQALQAGNAEWWFYERNDQSADGRVEMDVVALLLGQLHWETG